MGIDARLKRLEQAASKIPTRRDEPTVTVTLPDEWWAAGYQGLNTVSVEYMAQVEKIYGDEARERGESPLITYLRYAAYGGNPPPKGYSDAEVLHALRQRGITPRGAAIVEGGAGR